MQCFPFHRVVLATVTGGAVPLLAVLANVACFCKINVRKFIVHYMESSACSSVRVSTALKEKNVLYSYVLLASVL